ncbi:unnamed protein product [Symbiodinium microadriaticum]|nr:unnamed protein product [Symbiodinium microadriaticum]
MRANGFAGWLYVPLALLSRTHVLASDLCLRSGIAHESRAYIQDERGQDLSIGIFAYKRSSSLVQSHIAAILISEQLGYHVELKYENLGPFEAQSWLSCKDLNFSAGWLSDSLCIPGENRAHIALDTGFGALPYELYFTNLFRSLEACCQRSPRDLGSMGYHSRERIFMKRSQVDVALQDGFILNLHGSYNTTLHDPRKYFDGIDALNTSDLLPCNRTINRRLPIAPELESYVYWTGDTGGVTQDADGTKTVFCPNGHVWIAPACRNNVTSCIAMATFWSLPLISIMHWSAVHGLPLAVGYYSRIQDFFAKMRDGNTLFYWWEPENYEFGVDKVPLLFPVYNASEWAVGNQRTDQPPGYVGKLVSSNLQAKAPRVHTLIERFSLSTGMLEELNQLLSFSGISAGGTPTAGDDVVYRAACDWVRSSESLWRAWIPTTCDAGSGLVDAGGQYLLSRGDDAVGCSTCSSGRFSEPLLDGQGFIYRCAMCPPGTYQEFANQVGCNDCALGRFANETGATACSLCPLGTFADQEGRTSCASCGDNTWTTMDLALVSNEGSSDGGGRWIEVRGATSKDFCVCVEGRHFWQGQCELCLQGTTCLGPTSLRIDPGFFAFPEHPGNVFRCFGLEQRCQGGPPGSCAAGRSNQSLACAQCLPGFQAQADGQCRECAAADFAIVFGLCLLGVVFVGCLHASLIAEEKFASHGSQHGSLLNVALGLSQLVTCAQVFGVMRRLRIPWEEPFSLLLLTSEFLSLDALVYSFSSIQCVLPSSAVEEYLAGASLLPSAFVLSLILLHSAYISWRRSGLRLDSLAKTCGSFSMLFMISILSSILEPFYCNLHPNGDRTMQSRHDVLCNFRAEHLEICLAAIALSTVPIAFLSICVRIIVFDLPKRIQRADVGFVNACSFLVLRYRPGVEAFAVIVLLRNILVTLSPLITSQAGSLLLLCTCLYITFCGVAFWQPWRTKLATYTDLVMHAGSLLVLDMGKFYAPAAEDGYTLMIICIVASGIMLVWGTVVVLWAARHRFLKRQHFRFALSHHTPEAGTLARLLKIELQKRHNLRTFIGSDDLTDLTQHFTCIAQDVDTLVALAGRDFLLQRWCVGDVVTAKAHGVEVVLLSLPGFVMPDQQFVEAYEKFVPSVKELAVHGITLEQVRDSLTWCSSLERFDVVGCDPEMLTQAVGWLVGNDATLKHSSVVSESRSMSVEGTTYLILADTTHMEPQAAAYSLYMVLGAKFLELSFKGSLRVMRAEDRVDALSDSGTTQALLLLTAGCLEIPQMASWLLQLGRLSSSFVLPVVAEDSFQFPALGSSNLAALSDEFDDSDMKLYTQIQEAVFQEISVPFMPRSSNARQLDLQAKIIVERLSQTREPIQARPSMSAFPGAWHSPGLEDLLMVDVSFTDDTFNI